MKLLAQFEQPPLHALPHLQHPQQLPHSSKQTFPQTEHLKQFIHSSQKHGGYAPKGRTPSETLVPKSGNFPARYPYYHRDDHITPTTPVTTTIASLIQAQNVSRHYQLGDTTIPAVNDISLEIRPGEFVALLGSSGSGKSTFLNLLAGLDRPTFGAIHVRGRNLAAIDPLELARYRRDTVGMVFQSFNLLPRMTLAENVELPLRLAEVDRNDRAARVQSALEHVRLGARSRHRPPELSGGEQQRGAIARALVNRPTILFADEPTGNLDSVNGEQILLLLREIQISLGMTIIMVTHERPLAEQFASRIVTLGDGKLKSDTPNAAATLQSATPATTNEARP
jgi:putative ABC transport system ATP-binding protein